MARVSDTRRFITKYKPDVLKIDVEGYELFVLRPILPYINDFYRPTSMVEVGWEGLIRTGPIFCSSWRSYPDSATDSAIQMAHILSLTDMKNLDRTTDLLIEPR
jgi:Methyltransferase FkbM domain